MDLCKREIKVEVHLLPKKKKKKVLEILIEDGTQKRMYSPPFLVPSVSGVFS